jgi:SRSO17 transposase
MNYIGGLLGESERKNLSQMESNAVGVTYHRLHHFLTEAPWDAQQVNERRLLVMNQCSQTRINRGFTLIVDDSGHRKSAEPELLRLRAISRREWDGNTLEKLGKPRTE